MGRLVRLEGTRDTDRTVVEGLRPAVVGGGRVCPACHRERPSGEWVEGRSVCAHCLIEQGVFGLLLGGIVLAGVVGAFWWLLGR